MAPLIEVRNSNDATRTGATTIRRASVGGMIITLVETRGRYFVGVQASCLEYVEEYTDLMTAYREWSHAVLDVCGGR